MARTFVYSDNLTSRVEILTDDIGDRHAICAGCLVDLIEGTSEGYSYEDTQQAAGRHVDQCTRCADPDCRNDTKHDAGHRCRKD